MDEDAPQPEPPTSRGRARLPLTAALVFVFCLLAALPFVARPNMPPLTAALVLKPGASDPGLVQLTAEALQRRLDNAGIPGRVELAGGQIRVALSPGDLERAEPFLLERRVLQFLRVYETSEVEATLVTMMAEPDPEKREYLSGRDPLTGELLLLERRGGLGPEQFKDFFPAQGDGGRPCLGFKTTLEGGEVLHALTSGSIGRRLAVVLDGQVLSVPTIRSPLRGRGIITPGRADWDARELRVLVSSLRSGALPVDVALVRQETGSSD